MRRMTTACLTILLPNLILAACANNAPVNAAEISAQTERQSVRQVANETPIDFETRDGKTVAAIEGVFTAPENHDVKSGKTISLRYVRFPATGDKQGPPIVYLAGGPGGSGIGTAKGPRFPLFMAMRAFGDVIAFDQRGAGQSDTPPPCRSSVTLPATTPLSDETFVDLQRQSVRECAAFWKENGIDLAGYTTTQSVADLDLLRAHLGAERLSLWGISYGSHLALAAIKAMPEKLDRVIIASVEGLDQTVKSPAETDAYFDRLGAALNFNDLPEIIAAVHQRLEEEPVLLNDSYLFHRRDMQLLASAMIADPGRATQLVGLYLAAFNGDFSPIAQILRFVVTPDEPITWRAMSLAMDRASGISPARLRRIRQEAKSSLLGEALNFPMPHVIEELMDLDLGDAFREDPVAETPTLVLTGTLDGRTYPAEQRAATAGLRNAAHVTVVNAGHNLFMTTPEVQAAMEAFMRGESPAKTTITIDPPKLQIPE